MPTSLRTAVANYFRNGNRASGTRSEYNTTLNKWIEWGNGTSIEELTRKEV